MAVAKFKKSPSGKTVKTPQDYWAFVPGSLPPEIAFTSELVEALSVADRAVGELAGWAGPWPIF